MAFWVFMTACCLLIGATGMLGFIAERVYQDWHDSQDEPEQWNEDDL